MKRAPFLEVAASRTSLDGGNIISTYCGYILKWVVLIIYSICIHSAHEACLTSKWDERECKRNRRKGKVASVVLGDDTGIVAPSNTRIFPWLDFLPTSAFSPAPYLQLKWRSPEQVPCTRSLSHFGNARILFTVWTQARSPTKPHGHKNKKAIHGWKSPTKTELLVWMPGGGYNDRE